MSGSDERSNALTIDQVRRVAALGRLAIDDARLERYRHQLGSVLDHIKMLGELDLTDVEPMAHPVEATNRWDEDEVRPALRNDALMQLAPEKAEPFVKVPKVLGGGSGA